MEITGGREQNSSNLAIAMSAYLDTDSITLSTLNFCGGLQTHGKPDLTTVRARSVLPSALIYPLFLLDIYFSMESTRYYFVVTPYCAKII